MSGGQFVTYALKKVSGSDGVNAQEKPLYKNGFVNIPSAATAPSHMQYEIDRQNAMYTNFMKQTDRRNVTRMAVMSNTVGNNMVNDTYYTQPMPVTNVIKYGRREANPMDSIVGANSIGAAISNEYKARTEDVKTLGNHIVNDTSKVATDMVKNAKGAANNAINSTKNVANHLFTDAKNLLGIRGKSVTDMVEKELEKDEIPDPMEGAETPENSAVSSSEDTKSAGASLSAPAAVPESAPAPSTPEVDPAK